MLIDGDRTLVDVWNLRVMDGVDTNLVGLIHLSITFSTIRCLERGYGDESDVRVFFVACNVLSIFIKFTLSTSKRTKS